MKIVHINTFPYKATGMIMMNVHKALLKNGQQSYVVWGRGRKPENNNEISIEDNIGIKYHGVYTRLTDKTGFASKRATKALLSELDRIKPDIVHLHNIHGYYVNIEMLFSFLKNKSIKVVWTLHDCWSFTGHCAYFDAVGCEKWKVGCNNCPQKNTYPSSILLDNSSWNWNKKKDLFTGADITLVTPSEWLKKLVKQSFLKDYPTIVINNGIDLSVFKPTTDETYLDNLRSKYGLDKRPIILGVASEWTKRKGLFDFVELSQTLLEYQFVVVGLTEKQIKSIPKTLKGIKRTNNVQELVGLYSLATIFFNPTYEDNYPTTNLEAIACGTPVFTYDTGGSPESIVNGFGKVISKQNFVSEVNDYINSNKIINSVNESYSIDQMTDKYIELY